MTNELKEIEDEVLQMDEELAKLQEMTSEATTHEKAEPNANASSGSSGSVDEIDMDAESDMNRRSVYVGNVDYGSTPQELQEHFKNCGKILRVTILVDKFYGQPLGYAYIEFAESTSVANALMLTDSTFRNRPLRVVQKRKNVPGLAKTNGRGGASGGTGGSAPRGRGGRGGNMFPMMFGYNPYSFPSFPGRGMFMPGMYGYGPRMRGRYGGPGGSTRGAPVSTARGNPPASSTAGNHQPVSSSATSTTRAAPY